MKNTVPRFDFKTLYLLLTFYFGINSGLNDHNNASTNERVTFASIEKLGGGSVIS
jgi:hypothetical protein